MKTALPASALAPASFGSIGASSAGAAAAAVSGTASVTAIAGLSSLCGWTRAFDTLPSTIAKRAEARTQPATVLKLAISEPAAAEIRTLL
ncbi:MAG: hypothetical protein NTV97_14320 [Alphaproteobacteria bacterium]|nr:hypothetical protein [Alphaproteobacteria bacterium]